MPQNPPINDSDVLDLAPLALPVGPVRFPTGHTCAVKPMDALEFALYQKLLGTTDDAERNAAAEQLLRACVPDATDEDWASLDEDGRMGYAILGRAARRTRVVLEQLERLGNAGGGAPATTAAAPPTRRSGRGTTRSTSSGASRRGTAAATGRSRGKRTG